MHDVVTKKNNKIYFLILCSLDMELSNTVWSNSLQNNSLDNRLKSFLDIIRSVQNIAFCQETEIQSYKTHNKF